MQNLNNAVIITESQNNSYFVRLRQSNPFLSFKLISKADLIDNLEYSYDEKTILYLVRKGYQYDFSKELIKSLLFVKKDINKKIDELVSLKEELFAQGLLTYNDAFIALLKNKKIYVDYSPLDKELTTLLNNHHLDFEYLKKDEATFKHEIFALTSFDDELRYLFEKIILLFKSGVELNKIKVVVPNEEYLWNLKKYQNFYNFHFNFPSSTSYNLTEEFATLKSYLNLTYFEDGLNIIYHNSLDTTYLEKILKKYLDIKDVIKEDELDVFVNEWAKNMKIASPRYQNGIDVIDIHKINDESNYYLVLGFNSDNYPRIYADEDYLNDEEKALIGVNTSLTKNLIEKEQTISVLNEHPNVYLSYYKKRGREEINASLLNEELAYDIKEYHFSKVIFSKDHFNFFMSKIKDNYRNFAYRSPYFNSASNQELNYLIYDNKFKDIKDFDIKPLNLSYSSLNTYIDCPFKYYLNNILRVNEFEENFNTLFGGMVHSLYEEHLRDNEYHYEDYVERYFTKEEDKLLANALKDAVIFALDDFHKYLETLPLKNHEVEDDDYVYQINDQDALKGKIDLIVSDEDHYILFDHKTGDINIKKDYFAYGKELQLPIYYLLTRESVKYQNKELLGMYLHFAYSSKIRKGDTKPSPFRGLTFADLEKVDPTLTHLGKTKAIYDETDKEEILKVTKEKVAQVAQDIHEGKFSIAPLQIDNSELPCTNCSFKDICYMKKDDVNLVITKEEKAND